MTATRLRALLAADLYRHAGSRGWRAFAYHFLWTPGFRYSSLLRLYGYARESRLCSLGIRQFLALLLHHYSIRYGISISRSARIGSGLYIGHYGGIVVNADVVIGDNCNLSHDVTLGQSNRGSKAGCPVIGDNVYIGPGAKVFGRIQVGHHSAIGANSVVTSDVAERTVVAGAPARVLSDQGSDGYVNYTDYPPVPER